MSNPKPFAVITPLGTRWMVQFITADAAWRRIVSQQRLHDTAASREYLATKGWKVIER